MAIYLTMCNNNHFCLANFSFNIVGICVCYRFCGEIKLCACMILKVTGQLADAIGDFACLVLLFGGICETASCPVRDLSSPRVGNPRVGVSASCPVTILNARIISSPHPSCVPPMFAGASQRESGLRHNQ